MFEDGIEMEASSFQGTGQVDKGEAELVPDPN